ncbi:response regulator transcription factor [Pararobbsia alpina]|uniref:response regulator transcription factor n=1 Tax=Pararobbsia alpina TaxID=621374 RepID=UPI0039A612E4
MIAIIDDDESVRVALQNCAESYDLSALIYASAEEFLAAHPQPGLTCIVTDIQMPGMGGLALHAHLKRTGSTIPIVFITAFADEAIERVALESGVAGFFTKPFSADALMQRLWTLSAAKR